MAQPNYDEIENFSLRIIEIVKTDGISYIDAVTEYCEKSGIEIDMAAKLISSSIKSNIFNEAIDSKLIKKQARLPI